MALLVVALSTGCAGLSIGDRVAGIRLGPERSSAQPRHDVAAPSAIPLALVSAAPASFHARVRKIDDEIRSRMGTSWMPGCPVAIQDLRVIEMTFWSFDGRIQTGELMVHRRYVDDVLGVFRSLFEARFPIERMVLANGYMGNDPPLALRNNTAGFNCRKSVGDGTWSEHAFGRAVDINPDQNPYVSPSGRVEPPFGRPWLDRTRNDPAMIRSGDVVVRAFRAIGWRWGGTYRRSKDWMHFSVTGR